MEGTMKVGMYYSNRDVRVEQMPIPKVGKGDVLMKVKASGVCGSDVMEWYRIKKAPLVLGHEVTGEVVEVGEGVKRYKPGDRVFATHHVPCDDCYYCETGHETACEAFHTKNNFSPGGFAEYLKVSGRSVETGMLKLPDKVSYEKGSFIEPLGTVVRGLRKAKPNPDDSMLVLGAGIAGLLYIKLRKAFDGGKVIATDINEYRLEQARRFGAEYVIRADEDVPAFVKKVNGGRLADKVVVCTGAQSAARQALESVDKGGTVLFFAVPKPGEALDIDLNPYWRNDVSFRTSYGAAPTDNWQAFAFIRYGKVDVEDMITHRLGLDEIGEGFKLASEGKDCLKVIIEPNR